MGKLVQALVVPWLCLWLATVLVPQVSSQECSEESCALEAFRCQKANEQCCKEYVGCPCGREGYPGCGKFQNGLIPLGESTSGVSGRLRWRCTCGCYLMLICVNTPICPPIPPDCKDIVRSRNGCPECIIAMP